MNTTKTTAVIPTDTDPWKQIGKDRESGGICLIYRIITLLKEILDCGRINDPSLRFGMTEYGTTLFCIIGIEYDQGFATLVLFIFFYEVGEGEAINTEPEKCDDMKWFDLDNLPENIDYPVLFLERCLKGEVYQEEKL